MTSGVVGLPTTGLQGLAWQNPSGDQNNLVAPVDLDFTTYSQISVSPVGNWAQRGSVQATGVVIDNLLDVGFVTVLIGPIQETIPPFTKQTLQLTGGTAAIVFTGTAAKVRATFFHGAYQGSTAGTNFYQAQLQAGLAVETGMINMFAGNTAAIPAGYLLCDGSAVSRSTYAGLFTIIGTIYGTGDGSTTFNLPKLCDGVFPRGAGAGAPLGTQGGATQVTLTAAMMPVHTHAVTDPGHGHVINSYDRSFNLFAQNPMFAVDFDTSDSANINNWTSNSGNNYMRVPGRFQYYSPQRADGYYVSVGNALTGITIAFAGGTGGVNPSGSDATTQPTPTVPPYTAVAFIIKT